MKLVLLALLLTVGARADVARTILTRLGLDEYLSGSGTSLRHRMVAAYRDHIDDLLAATPPKSRELVAEKLSDVRLVPDVFWEPLLASFGLDGKDTIGFVCLKPRAVADPGVVYRRLSDAGFASALFAQVHEDRHVAYFWGGPRSHPVRALFHPIPIGMRDEYQAFRGEARFQGKFDFEEVVDLMLEEYAVPKTARAAIRTVLLDPVTFAIDDAHLPALAAFLRESPILALLEQKRYRTPERFALASLFDTSYLAQGFPDCAAKLLLATSIAAIGGAAFRLSVH